MAARRMKPVRFDLFGLLWSWVQADENNVLNLAAVLRREVEDNEVLELGPAVAVADLG